MEKIIKKIIVPVTGGDTIDIESTFEILVAGRILRRERMFTIQFAKDMTAVISEKSDMKLLPENYKVEARVIK